MCITPDLHAAWDYATTDPGHQAKFLPHVIQSPPLHCAVRASDAGEEFAMALAQAAAARVCATTLGVSSPFPWPFYLIGTRDSFTFELVVQSSQVRHGI